MKHLKIKLRKHFHSQEHQKKKILGNKFNNKCPTHTESNKMLLKEIE